MIYQHPLAYLLGLEGIALLRGWAGDYDKDYIDARLAEVRRLLDDEKLAGHEGVMVGRGDTWTGYRQWAASYDEPRNDLFDCDEPIMHEIIDSLPTGTALDAACGTGRYAEYLKTRGHQVIGVDSSEEMLDRARVRVGEATFLRGDLRRLPVPDSSVDLVVSGLALAHIQDLEPVMAEFARVLRPGGHVVISDAHHELILRGSVVAALGPAGEPGLVATYRHTAGTYLRAALRAGLQVRRCEEPGGHPRAGQSPPRSNDIELEPGSWHDWPWSLLELVPEATWGAGGNPCTIIWHFQLDRGTAA